MLPFRRARLPVDPGGIALLGEALSLRLALSAAAVLGGIALVIAGKRLG